jgi:hypothetical protein
MDVPGGRGRNQDGVSLRLDPPLPADLRGATPSSSTPTRRFTVSCSLPTRTCSPPARSGPRTPPMSPATVRANPTRAPTASTGSARSDGDGLTRITDAGGGIAVLIDYSLDGNRMVFGRRGPDFECTKRSALFVVNVDGSLSGSKRCSDYAAALSYSWMSPSSTSRGRTFFRRTFAGSNLGSGSSRSTPRCGLARL